MERGAKPKSSSLNNQNKKQGNKNEIEEDLNDLHYTKKQ